MAWMHAGVHDAPSSSPQGHHEDFLSRETYGAVSGIHTARPSRKIRSFGSGLVEPRTEIFWCFAHKIRPVPPADMWFLEPRPRGPFSPWGWAWRLCGLGPSRDQPPLPRHRRPGVAVAGWPARAGGAVGPNFTPHTCMRACREVGRWVGMYMCYWCTLYGVQIHGG